jgi:hypothetical protein
MIQVVLEVPHHPPDVADDADPQPTFANRSNRRGAATRIRVHPGLRRDAWCDCSRHGDGWV